MTRHDAIVIGAGVNGLVAATVLARAGLDVCVIEQSDRLGGMATLSVDDGPELAHLVHNLSPRVRRDIGLDPHRWPFRQTALPTVALDESGRHVIVTRNAVTFADGTAHPDARACLALTARLRRYGELLRMLAEAAPPGGDAPLASARGLRQILRLGRFGLGLRGLGRAEARRFLQVLLSNAYDLIRDDLPEGPLAGMLAADAVRGIAQGPRSPGTVFTLIHRYGHGGVAALPQGGMSAVVDALAQAARDVGCTLRTGVRATGIQLQDDRVCAVTTASGETLLTSRVLVGSGPRLAAELVGAGAFDIEAMRRIGRIRARGVAAKVNLRLDRMPDVPGLNADQLRGRLVFAPGADYVEAAFNPAKYGEMSDNPVIEAVIRDEGAIWLSAVVQYAPSDLNGGWSDAARAALARRTLATLGRAIPGLDARVRETQVIAPDAIAAATGAPGGHWHHAEMTLDQILTLRPANGIGRYAIGPRGLFLCGASTHPGGDVMGLAGRNAAREVLG
ncbi:MAG: NAD(P)/FAD-dependent oxidoreductase [Rhodobacteraceae bacterium]|nr:NAD(P)/FAD-dependent oxidoreductase [Paracoccaceae bacterium]